MKQLAFLVWMILIILKNYPFAYSQAAIALESGGNTTIYQNLDSAMAHAVDGDIMYLPGGSFTPAGGTWVINKRINVYGAGYFPDSSIATGQTILNGNINIRTGADGGLIQGLYVTGNITFGTNNTNNLINGYSISRCLVVGQLILSYNNSNHNPYSSNIYLSENVFRNAVNLSQVKNLLISKNIFENSVSNTNGLVTFRNNIFLYQASNCFYFTFFDIKDALFYDNIINHINIGTWCWGIFSNCTGNVFYNNMFSANITFPMGGNFGYNNIVSQNINDIYVSHTFDIYNYYNDYRLKPSCPGVGAGSDGTDIGLYGTTQPFKAGGVPQNPHIQTKSIAPTTNSQGQLLINIRVGAQTH